MTSPNEIPKWGTHADSAAYRPSVIEKFNERNKPSTETLSPGIDQIPFEGLEAIGEIFKEGEFKYGRDNWKKQPDDPEYNAERCRHAIRHLYLYANGDRSENHLAKVAWFCVITIWRSKQQASIASTQDFKLPSTSEPISQQ